MKTGATLSFNPEARRIVDVLRNPDQPPEDLLRLLTVRLADGSAYSLQRFPLTRVLGLSGSIPAPAGEPSREKRRGSRLLVGAQFSIAPTVADR